MLVREVGLVCCRLSLSLTPGILIFLQTSPPVYGSGKTGLVQPVLERQRQRRQTAASGRPAMRSVSWSMADPILGRACRSEEQQDFIQSVRCDANHDHNRFVKTRRRSRNPVRWAICWSKPLSIQDGPFGSLTLAFHACLCLGRRAMGVMECR